MSASRASADVSDSTKPGQLSGQISVLICEHIAHEQWLNPPVVVAVGTQVTLVLLWCRWITEDLNASKLRQISVPEVFRNDAVTGM